MQEVYGANIGRYRDDSAWICGGFEEGVRSYIVGGVDAGTGNAVFFLFCGFSKVEEVEFSE